MDRGKYKNGIKIKKEWWKRDERIVEGRRSEFRQRKNGWKRDERQRRVKRGNLDSERMGGREMKGRGGQKEGIQIEKEWV